jgi:1-deoxy-D-xylulose-5-phosphate synthase
MLADAAKHRAVVTCEDGIRDGGIGMGIADRIGSLAPAVPIHVLGTPARFIAHDGRAERIHHQLGLDAAGISAAVRLFQSP